MDKYTELLNKITSGKSSSNTTLAFPTKQNVPIPPQMPQATTQRATTSAKGKAVVPTNSRQRYQESTRQGYQQALQDNAGARFHAGLMEGLSPVSLGLESEALEGSKAFLAGNVAGTMGQFAIPYAGVTPKLGKALSSIPKYANMGKVGQAVARGVATDLAVGVPLNTLYGVSKEGLEGKELAKSIGINTAIDLVAGGLIEVVPSAVKGMQKLVNKQTGETVAEVADEVVEAIPKQADTITPTTNNKKVESFPYNKYGDEIKQGGDYESYKVTTDKGEYVVQLYKYDAGGYGERVQVRISTPNNWKSNSLVESSFSNAESANKYVDLFIDYSEGRITEDDLIRLYNDIDKPQTPVQASNRPVEPRTPQSQPVVPNAHKTVTKQANNVIPPPGKRDLGADISRPQKTSEELIKEHGLIKPGMEPKAREARIPKATDAGDVQLGIRTSAEAKAINEQSYKEIQSAVEEGMATKFTVTNEKAVGEASKKIADNGLEKAHDEFRGFVQSGKMPKSKDIALGYRLMQEYQKAGDYKKVAELAIDVSELLSETGRSLQAAQIIKKLSPEGRLMSAQRIAKKLSDRLGKDIRLDDETINQILKARTEAEIAEATQKAGVKIWNQVPSGLQNKANAWRYMSMLMNPKTHIRNIVGNLAFMPARGLKNIIGTGLEKISRVEVGQRTKAIINPLNKSDQALLKLADKDFGEIKNILRGEAKYDDTIRPLEAKVFNTKILEAGRKLNLNLLDGEDIFFMRAAYDSSFAQYMKANKIDINNLDFTTLQKARNYAADEALKATYRDYNKLASSISKLKHNLATSPAQSTSALWFKRGAGVALEGVLPFTKTPMNLLRRGVEYSPVSLATGVNDMLKAIRKGKVPPAEALDRLAAGMSGTSILLLGMLLQRQGIVVGGSDNQYSSKQYQWENMTGMQEYAIDTGDGTYTLDWAAPMSMPFFVGVEFSKMLGQEEGSFVNIADAITAIDEPIFNMSMLQGINQALNTWSQSEGIGGALGEIAFNMALSYAGQFVPTVGGQIARTLDGTRRVTTSTNESATVRKVEREARRQGNKNFLVPLLKDAPAVGKYAEKLENEPYIDLWGRKESSGGAFQNFISPGYYRPANETKVDKEIGKLIESLDSELAKDVIPRVTNSYTITQDKVDYRLSEKELTRFKEVRGKESYDGMNRLINSSAYQKMSPEEKVKAIKKVYDSAYQKAKEELLKKRAAIPIKK